MADDSELIVDKNGRVTTFVGKDGVHLARAITTKSAINLYLKTRIKPTRGVGIKKLLAIATQYTKNPYKISEMQKAIDELDTFINTLQSALPVTERKY